ncbi:hypothetical protein QTP88_016464 [Uroleucon formosanum]
MSDSSLERDQRYYTDCPSASDKTEITSKQITSSFSRGNITMNPFASATWLL